VNHIELSKRALKDLRRIDHANRQTLRAGEQAGFLVERVIDRGDLERATATLPS
jgi:hypothetical protein